VTSLTSARDSVVRGKLPSDVVGIRITLAERPLATTPPVIHGAYRIPEADLADFASPFVRALVLVAQLDLAPTVVSPFTEQLLFEDDQVRTQAGVEGAFTLDVFELLRLTGPERSADRAGHYHLFVSLGPHVSNVIEADVAG
jgi:hypothetical protein